MSQRDLGFVKWQLGCIWAFIAIMQGESGRAFGAYCAAVPAAIFVITGLIHSYRGENE